MTVIEEKPDLRKNDKSEAPKDRYYSIFILFFLLGLVHVLPWSFFSTATEYWMYKFRNTSINETNSEFRTTLQADFNASILIMLQTSQVIFLFLSLLFGSLVPVRIRLIAILSIFCALFTILTIFIKIDTDSWQEGFFALVMIIVFGINSINAIFAMVMYTILACFPQKYLAPYVAGQGVSKIVTAVLQILSLALGLSVQDSALVYFFLGLFVIASTFILFLMASGQNQFYLYHMKGFKEKKQRITLKKGLVLSRKIWSIIAMNIFGVLNNNTSPTALVVSEGEGNGPWNDIYFIPTITYLLAACIDQVGRNIGFWFNPKITSLGWVAFSALRAGLLIPLFMFCNAQPRHHLPVLLPHDYQYIIILVVSHVTEGILITRCLYNIASLVTPEELEDGYHINMISLGLAMGILSFVSIVSVDLL